MIATLEALALLAVQEGGSASVLELVEQLGSDRIEIRDWAQRGLARLGRAALGALERASVDADPELAWRAHVLLREMPREVDVSLEEKLLAKAPLNWTLEFPADRRLFVWHASAVFSRDGRRAGFAGGDRGHGFNVVNGVRSEGFDWVSRPEFGEQGNALVYHVGKGERRFFFLNGVKHEVFGRMRSFVLSPDGRRTAYLSGIGKPWESRSQVVVDGVQEEEFDEVDQYSLRFSADGKRVAYRAWQGGKMVAVVDGVKSPEYAYLRDVLFTPDSRHVAFVADGGEGDVLLLDGERMSAPFSRILHLQFSPDGRRLAFIVGRQSGSWCAILDGIAQEPLDGASALMFSPDGSRIAYHAELKGKKFVIVDHERVELEGYSLWPGVFSPNGKRFACQGWGREGACMIVDGVKGETVRETTSPIFSPDSRHFAYVARWGDRYWPVIDGVKGEAFDFVGPITFTTDGRKACYGIRKGHELWWKVTDVPER